MPCPIVLKHGLQVVVCITLSLRRLLLVSRLRHLWMAQCPDLAAEFRQELRRRGLLTSLPRSQGSGG